MSPQRHEFRYRIFLMYLDLSELAQLFDGRWFWSATRPALAWFKREDHLGDPSKSLDSEVRALVEKETGRRPGGRITLLTHLRYFGYCMNPVSFYYCWNENAQDLETIVAEVHNTPWNERHCYVLDARTARNGDGRAQFEFKKAFHVSPFMPMEQDYAWKFSTPGETLNVHMESYESGQKLFDASMHLNAEPITAWSLARVLIGYPFMTGRVILAIYWQALQLWRKRTPFYNHPKHRVPREINR
jgi:uncharacterized protein